MKRSRGGGGGGAGHKAPSGTALPTPHRRGQVVQIQMTNFMAFDCATLFPGPFLNLVIGPNGTGKSTLVCALCLALGGEAKVLGRADKMQDFVRHGCDEATVEVVLAMGENATPVRISRSFRRNGGNASTFTLNGKRVGTQQVLEFVRKLGVQVDNLCQFLPQDRVRDFSRLKPDALLKATQQAVLGDAHVQLQNDIVLMQGSGGQERVEYDALVNKRSALVVECSHLEQEVERVKELERAREFLRMLQQVVVLRELGQLKADKTSCDKAAKDAREKLQAATANLVTLEKPLKPMKRRIADIEGRIRTLRSKYDHGENAVNDLIQSECDKHTNFRLFADRFRDAKEEEEQRLRDIARFEKEEEQCQRELDSAVNVDHTKEIDDLRRQIDTLRAQLSNIQQHKDDRAMQRSNLKRDLEMLSHEKARLADPAVQCLQRLLTTIRSEELKQNIMRVREFVAKSPSVFEGRVYGPIALELKVTQGEHAKIVEHCVPKATLRAFCVEKDADRDTLLGVAAVDVLTIPSTPLPSHPLHPDAARQLGIQAFVDELVEMPPPVRAALCAWAKIHMIAVADKNTDYDRVFQSDAVQTMVVGDQYFTSRRSAYTNNRSTTALFIHSPRVLASDTVSNRLLELNESIQKTEQQLALVEPEVIRLQSEEERLHHQTTALRQKRHVLQTEQKARESAAVKLLSVQTKLKRLRNQQSLETTLSQIHARTMTLAKERVTLALKLQKLLAAQRDALFEQDQLVVQGRCLELSHEKSLVAIQQMRAEEQRLRDELDERDKELAVVKTQYEDKKREAKEVFGGSLPSNDTQRETLKWEKDNSLKEVPVPNLKAKVEAKKIEISAMCPDEGSVARLEHKQEELRNTEAKIEDLKKKLENRDAEVQKKRQQWLGPVKDMVARIDAIFGKLFDRMGFVGQVKLHEDSVDVSKCELHIRVKFHEEQNLRLLVSTSQSGGEQSVTTAAFLLALQQLDQAPFRLVDEINQGMDACNERKICKLLLQASSPYQALLQEDGISAEHTSQYFMITPKLLPNLEFDESVAVHVVFNGPLTPPSSKFQEAMNSPAKRRRVE